MPKSKRSPRAARPKKTMIEAAAKLIESHAFRVKVARDPIKALHDFGLDEQQIRLFAQLERRGASVLAGIFRQEFSAAMGLIRRHGPFNYMPPAELRGITAGRAAGEFVLSGRGLKGNMRVRISRAGGRPVVVVASRRTVGADMFDRVTLRRRLAPGRYRVSVEVRPGAFSNSVPLTVKK